MTVSQWPARGPTGFFATLNRHLTRSLGRSSYVQALYQRWAFQKGTAKTPFSNLQERALICSTVIDTTLGLVTGALLLRHQGQLQALATHASECLVDRGLTQGTEWLMTVAPAGLKLNEELDMFMGRAVLGILKAFIGLAARHQTTLVNSLFWFHVLSSPFGLSPLLGLSSDLLALTTCHVSLLYWLSSLAYSHQLRALAALWRLFRGKKLNPLRRRIDSFDCRVEQIVVGSLLFTPLLLLLPTTWAYYSLFAIAYCGIAGLRIGLQVLSAVVRSFPVYRLGVWAVKPESFPVEVSFQVTSAGEEGSQATSVVKERHRERGGTRGVESEMARQMASAGKESGGRRREGDAWEKGVLEKIGREARYDITPGLAELLTEEELRRRHLKLELVTADAADVLRPFLEHVTSPFSLGGLARIALALTLGHWVDPVLTFDDVVL